MGPIHTETASGLIQDCLMSESNNKSLQKRAQPPLKTPQFVCLFVVGPDGMSTLQQLTHAGDGWCVCGERKQIFVRFLSHS